MSVSMFKMIMLYKIVDLNIELEELNKNISEIERNISSAEYLTSAPEVNLSDIKKQSKKLGFTDKNDVAYVKFH